MLRLSPWLLTVLLLGGCYWDPVLSGACSDYWSSLSCGRGSGWAWGLSFYRGCVAGGNESLNKSNYSYVRCVRRSP